MTYAILEARESIGGTCGYVCRLLNYMDERGYRQCTPSNDDPSITVQPFIDLPSGYAQRSIHSFPEQGPKEPWRVHQNYVLDLLSLKRSEIDDAALSFSRGSSEQVAIVQPLAATGA